VGGRFFPETEFERQQAVALAASEARAREAARQASLTLEELVLESTGRRQRLSSLEIAGLRSFQARLINAGSTPEQAREQVARTANRLHTIDVQKGPPRPASRFVEQLLGGIVALGGTALVGAGTRTASPDLGTAVGEGTETAGADVLRSSDEQIAAASGPAVGEGTETAGADVLRSASSATPSDADLFTEETGATIEARLTNDSILNSIADTLTSVIEKVPGELTDLGKVVADNAAGVAGSLGGLLQSAVRLLAPGITAGGGALQGILRELLTGRSAAGGTMLQVLRTVLLTTHTVGTTHGARALDPTTRMLSLALPLLLSQRSHMLKVMGFDEEVADPLLSAEGAVDLSAIFPAGGFGSLLGTLMKAAADLVTLMVNTINGALSAPDSELEGGMRDLGQAGADVMELLHLPMTAILERLANLFFQRVDEKLAGIGEVTPEGALELSGQMVAIAGGLGLGAHLFSVVAELFHPLKHLGFPQIAALLSDLANFRGIAQSTIGQQLDVMLRSPMRRQALQRFRPELHPDPIFDQIFLERRVSDEQFRQHYRERGWTEDMIEVHRLEVFREPTPRELGLVFEDADAPDEWVQRMLTQSGYDDESIPLLLNGVRTRSTKTVRGELLAAVKKAFEAGVINLGEAEEHLRVLKLRPESLELWVAGASLGRFTREVDERKKIFEEQATVGGLTFEALQAELAGLGVDEREQTQSVNVVRARLNLESFRDVHADQKAQQRLLQSEQITRAQELFRRFQIDEVELEAEFLAAGVLEARAPELVRLAQIRRTPVPRLATVLSPDAHLQMLLKKQAEQVLLIQRAGQITEPTSILLQIGLGVEPLTAQLDAGLVAARLIRPQLSEEQARTRAEAKEQQRQATVVARAAGRQQQQLERASQRELTATVRASEDAALALFRKGQMTEDQLTSALIQLGRAPDTANAIVARELARRRATASTTAAPASTPVLAAP